MYVQQCTQYTVTTLLNRIQYFSKKEFAQCLKTDFKYKNKTTIYCDQAEKPEFAHDLKLNPSFRSLKPSLQSMDKGVEFLPQTQVI